MDFAAVASRAMAGGRSGGSRFALPAVLRGVSGVAWAGLVLGLLLVSAAVLAVLGGRPPEPVPVVTSPSPSSSPSSSSSPAPVGVGLAGTERHAGHAGPDGRHAGPDVLADGHPGAERHSGADGYPVRSAEHGRTQPDRGRSDATGLPADVRDVRLR